MDQKSAMLADEECSTSGRLSLVVPTYNERANITGLVAAVSRVLEGLDWEIIVVDDDSPDRTFEEVRRMAVQDHRVRCLRRVGRRGLSSAVIEGALAASGEFIGVMDADFQHDERILGVMYRKLCDTEADVAVATRYDGQGGVGDWNAGRQAMSRLATWVSRLVVGGRTTDPMSGFFMFRRDLLDDVVYDLSAQGYKILLDILASARRPLRVEEVPFVFRVRTEGESKISAMVIAEYATLMIEKLSHGFVPGRFVLFCMVGSLGILVHMIVLWASRAAGVGFEEGQLMATFIAMLFNFGLNNEVTYRRWRLSGTAIYGGVVAFCAVCSIGALANVSVAELALTELGSWPLAGLSGALIGGVINFSIADNVVWQVARRRGRASSLQLQRMQPNAYRPEGLRG
ncbi:MAG: Dolichyl-phosphate beta-D-mannosyltransferase [Proteobacteria bacterium]|nr:Dolichyl-phosphate beta-D-mannosyltransferase [Pseudomonadota bacterium]